jgi:galactokinase
MPTLRSTLIDAMGGLEGLSFARAPGRVNLIGDHTDYQDGLCVPMAIDREVTVAFRRRDDGRVTVASREFDGRVDIPADGSATTDAVEPAWGRTVAAVLTVLAARGRAPVGFDARVASTIPVGSGLSSSAALEVATALAAARAGDLALAGPDLALAAQAAEHLASGVPCGVMDQMASVFGRAGHALLLDCRSLEVTPVALPPGVAVVVVHSGLPRRLEDSAYAQRRAACEAAAARLGVPALRDATPEHVADDPIARHVVSENARVGAFVAALRAGDTARCGELMRESHASLRDDFRVSTPELDLLTGLLVEHGAFGARLTGAGFGGCVVALTDGRLEPGIVERYDAATGRRATLWTVEAVDGAGIEED